MFRLVFLRSGVGFCLTLGFVFTPMGLSLFRPFLLRDLKGAQPKWADRKRSPWAKKDNGERKQERQPPEKKGRRANTPTKQTRRNQPNTNYFILYFTKIFTYLPSEKNKQIEEKCASKCFEKRYEQWYNNVLTVECK